MRYKLICTAAASSNGILAKVAPQLVDANSPFYNIQGSTSIIQFHTDVLPNLTLIEGAPTPMTTAYGLLADLITAARWDRVFR